MSATGFTGGDKLESFLKDVERKASGDKTLRVGFLETETYPDGEHVAQVAFENEYGNAIAPPRPFFRQTIASKGPRWGGALGKALKAAEYDENKALALMGEGIKDQITQSIVEFKTPGNAPSTIARKGFDKPLIDTGQMQRSVDYDIEE